MNKIRRHSSSARISIFYVILCLVFLMTAFMAACQSGAVDESPTLTSAKDIEVLVMSDLPEPSGGVVKIEEPRQTEGDSTDDSGGRWKVFSSQGVTIAPGDDMESVLRDLGDPNSTYESPSCLFEGNDLVYDFDGFEINAAIIDGKETCVAVFLTDDSAQTPEGITIGSSLSDMLEAFGEPDGEEVGQYTWLDDDSELVIVVIDDSVSSISYLMLVDPETD